MDWQTILSVAGLVLFIILMMRGGGMGCCGMGRHDHRSKGDGATSREDKSGGRAA